MENMFLYITFKLVQLIKGTLGAHQTQQWHYTILSAVHSCMPHTSVGMCFLVFNIYRATSKFV